MALRHQPFSTRDTGEQAPTPTDTSSSVRPHGPRGATPPTDPELLDHVAQWATPTQLTALEARMVEEPLTLVERLTLCRGRSSAPALAEALEVGARIPGQRLTEAATGQSLDRADVQLGNSSEARAASANAFADDSGLTFGTTSPDLAVAAEEGLHWMQFQLGSSPEGQSTTAPTEPAEQEAQHMGQRIAQGQSVGRPRQRPTGARARNPDDGATTQDLLDDVILTPAHRNEVVADWGWSEIKTGEALNPGGETGPLGVGIKGHFATEAEAIAAVTASGDAGAVFLEQGRYVAYEAHDTSMLYAFNWDNCRHDPSEPWTNVEFKASARAIVTADGVPLRSSQFKSSRDAKAAGGDETLMPGYGDAFAGHQSNFQGDDAEALDEDAFLTAFGAAMKDNALSVVHRAKAEADRYRDKAASGMGGEEVALMQKTANEAAALQVEHDAIPDLTWQIGLSAMGTPEHSFEPNPLTLELWDKQQQYNEQRAALKDRQRATIARYPMLARVVDDIEDFSKKSSDDQLALLGNEAAGVMADIDTTRENIIDGSLDLWVHKNIVESTIAGLGISDETQRQWALDKCQSEQNWDTAGQIALTVFAVGFGIGAAVFSGGTSLALAAGALGLGAADAIMQTDQYMVDSAAGNTDINPEESLVPPDLAGHWGWLVVAWVGVVLDAADVVKAVRAVKGAGGIIEEGIEALAKGDPKLAEQLRVAARHNLTADDLVDLTNKDVIARQLGAEVEIDDALGAEVRVHYDVDAQGRVKVTEVRLGPAATIIDALAHAEVVRLMRRYDGALGKLRETWDRLRSFAGFGFGADVNPFPAGSLAYESWLEMKKLPTIIETRRAALGNGLDASKEAALRAEVEFLEGELKHHQKVVDQVTLEKGVGFVAKAEESTREAVAWGLPKLEGNPMIADASKYFYRRNPNGTPPFILSRTAVEEAPPRSVAFEGDKWVIIEGDLSRTERASRMVAAWPDGVQTAFKALEEAHPNAFKVVPLKGVATTGVKLGDHIDEAMEDELLTLLQKAFTNSGAEKPAQAAQDAVDKILDHQITVVRGTDQLRAYNYRLNFKGETPEKDLHHVIALYMGGDHTLLANVDAGSHKRLHELFDNIELSDDMSLAPHSLQNSSELLFNEGGAVLHPDGTVGLFKLNPDGRYTQLN